MAAVFCYVTCPERAGALAIARALVEEGLAAAGNVLGGARSVYRWQGAVHEADEAVLVVKTRAALADRVVARVRELHPYACPAVAVLPVAGGDPDYLAWIEACGSGLDQHS